MSDRETSQLDDEIRAAFLALDGVVLASLPPSYGDDLGARVSARIEADDQAAHAAMASAAASEPVVAASGDDADASATSSPDEAVVAQESEDEEDSALHDIRALARSAKLRIASEREARARADAPLFTPVPTLREVILPEPAAMAAALELAPPAQATEAHAPPEQAQATSQTTMSAAPARSRVATSRPNVTADEDERDGMPSWIYAAVAAVAAVAVIFFISREKQTDVRSERTPGQASKRGEHAAAPLSPSSVPGTGGLSRSDALSDARSGALSDARSDARSGVLSMDSQDLAKDKRIESRSGGSQAAVADDNGAGTPQDSLQAALDSVDHRIRACGEKYRFSGTLWTRIEIAPNGDIDAVKVTDNENGNGRLARCVIQVVESIELPAFEGGRQVIEHPFFISP